MTKRPENVVCAGLDRLVGDPVCLGSVWRMVQWSRPEVRSG